jgi:putative ABC transport system ATP-binding protein
MAALDEPTAGRVTWPALASPPAIGDIGTAFQSASLIPWLNVEENVELPLLLATRERPGDPQRLLERLGVGSLAKKLPSELSGGQAQRVGLARAMVSTPALLLADEPSGQLDHHTGGQVMAALKEWADANGTTLVIATHDPMIAALMARQWTLDHGQMTEIPR